MENENKPKSEAAEKAQTKLEAVRAVKKLNNGTSQWSVVQEIFQEIQAGHIVANPDKQPAITVMAEELKKEIESRYSEDEDTKNLLLDAVPAVRSIREWVKKDGWEEAVWKYVKADKLFSAHKRAEVIEALRQRAINNSDQAAKLWLTLSGDYAEKMEVNDKTVDTFRDINNILHRKSRDE